MRYIEQGRLSVAKALRGLATAVEGGQISPPLEKIPQWLLPVGLPKFEIQFSNPPKYAAERLGCLGLNTRTRNTLARAEVVEIEELLLLTKKELLNIRGIGKKSLAEINAVRQKLVQRVLEESRKNPQRPVIIQF